MTAVMDPAVEFAAEPPHDIQAEMITLGAMMAGRGYVDEIAEIIGAATAFYRPAHQAVYAAIMRLRDAGEPTGWVAVKNELERTESLRGNLDAPYIHTLTEAVPAAATGPYYARRVAGLARTRTAQERLMRALQITRSPGFDPDEDMDRVRQEADVATGDRPAGSARWLATEAYEVLWALEKPLPKDTLVPPYADLRDLVPALRPGQLITVAARPSIGKTVVTGDFARHVALRLNQPVAWFSLEMSREEIITRAYAAEARVDLDHLQQHACDEAEWIRLGKAAEQFSASNLLIDDQGGITLAHISAALRTMSRTAAPKLAVIDYVQLATMPGAPSRQDEVAQLVRGLKELAKRHEIPVLMAAQLNRNPEGRQDKRPALSDIRETGEVENSSDIVILLYREDYYERETQRAGEMDLIVAKNRNGRTGTASVAFQGRFCRCVDMARDDTPAPSTWSPTAVLERQ